MSNRANNSKESILCDAKELMKLYDRVTWHLPKARREHSAVRRFEDAGYAIIHYCTIAMELKGENEQQRKREYVEHLIGSFGEMLAAFDILMDMKDMTQKKSDADSKGEMHLFSDSAKLAIARLLERIETGAKKRRLAKKGVTLNEKKFYDQPYYHGCEFLGSHIRPNRIHLNNKTYDNAVRSIEKMNENRYKDIDAMVSVFNSYSGLLKNRTDYKRLIELRDKLLPEWWQWLSYDEQRRCLVYLPQYSINERLNIKYHLKLKHYDTIRNHRAEKCSVQRTQHAGVAA